MDKQEKKQGKRWIVIISIVLVLIACIVLYLLWGVKDYMDKVPDITPKEKVTVKTGQTLTAEDMFDITCKGDYKVSLNIMDSDIPDAKVTEEKQALFVGSSQGTIRVLICVTGEVAESTDAENTIVVIEEN